MTSNETGPVAFLAFLVGLLVALVLVLGTQASPPEQVWTPQTVAPAVPTKVEAP